MASVYSRECLPAQTNSKHFWLMVFFFSLFLSAHFTYSVHDAAASDVGTAAEVSNDAARLASTGTIRSTVAM